MNLSEASQQRLELLSQDSLKRTLLPCPLDQRISDFSSNDYLCLSQRPEIIEAGQACARQYGAGATGSRLLSGNLDCFEQLESQVAQFKNAEAALVFSSGYQANASGLAALLDKSLWAGTVGGTEPLVFTDRLNHASLHHACQLAGIRQIRFRHNDMAHLAELLAKHAESTQPKIIVTETVFGMEGDLLPVEQLAEIALVHKAVVYLDEAHATGVWGPNGRGLGAVKHPDIDALKAMGHWIVMGTFSKAVGVSGAYIACSEIFKQYLVNRCTGFVYSTAPSPFVIGAVARALEIIPQMETERTALHLAAEQLRGQVHALGFDTGLSNTHIVPLVVGSAEACLELKSHLQQAGIRTSAVRPPTVPPNAARVRLALNTGHSDELYSQLLECLQQWKRRA
ncbi:MAG: 8-amino-7-oxononanoate synthase [Limnobacter sp.]|uniref:aminotransferase class I/II-fold pyridoxal phosphate-dependent enzyme n=1 Tax=Limnobacter sp. TaxID=2003368 RepID=UPI0022C7B9F5|nr:8-amino-7-oxononanoate synthase [Limnobacter sp.]MCZ8014934.1 8-amino-7-oxononanoate synthase [Limnobacter sp.]